MADPKSNEKLPEHTPEKPDRKPIAENLSDSDLEEVSGGAGELSGLSEVKNNVCGSNC